MNKPYVKFKILVTVCFPNEITWNVIYIIIVFLIDSEINCYSNFPQGRLESQIFRNEYLVILQQLSDGTFERETYGMGEEGS